MAAKYQLITELYRRTGRDVTRNPQAWQGFLSSACRNYKCRFDEQLLIYAQRPDAVAVAEIGTWNRLFKRWVNKDSKGIAVFDPKGRRNTLKYYFDVSDTHEGYYGSRPVPIWQMDKRYEQPVMDKIADGLMADGILTGAGKTKWHTSTINKILRNEKYMGDALLQKTYTTDFLTKKRIKNNGTVPQYYVEGDHEAIIPKELFMQVQAELVRRRVVHVSPTGKKRSFSCNHCFAQMIFCGDCGELYRRVHWNNHGCKSIVWRCISRLDPTSAEKNCTNRTVNELLLQEITVKAFNQVLTERDFFFKTLQQNIAKAVVNADTLSPDGIQVRLEELQKELIKKANNKQDYDAIADEIFRLRDQKEQSELDSHHREEVMNRIKELQNFIAGQETDITEFDEALVKKLIEKITVFADHFTVEFKSGITIDIEA